MPDLTVATSRHAKITHFHSESVVYQTVTRSQVTMDDLFTFEEHHSRSYIKRHL